MIRHTYEVTTTYISRVHKDRRSLPIVGIGQAARVFEKEITDTAVALRGNDLQTLKAVVRLIRTEDQELIERANVGGGK